MPKINISNDGDNAAWNVNSNEIWPTMAALAAAIATRPRIANPGQIMALLGQYGAQEVDPEIHHEVVKFATLAQMNAARISVTGDARRAVGEYCANGREFFAAIREGILLWMIPKIPVHEGLYRNFMDLMFEDDLAKDG